MLGKSTGRGQDALHLTYHQTVAGAAGFLPASLLETGSGGCRTPRPRCCCGAVVINGGTVRLPQVFGGLIIIAGVALGLVERRTVERRTVERRTVVEQERSWSRNVPHLETGAEPA